MTDPEAGRPVSGGSSGRSFGASWARATSWLSEPVDGSSLVFFRIAFGLILAFGAARFLWNDWVTEFHHRPTFFFTYWGFSWVRPLPEPWMHVLYGALVVSGLLIASGLFYRVAIVVAFVLFTWAELVDVTNYLNHYYLVSLLAGVMVFLPLHRSFSVDAMLRPSIRSATVPRLALVLVRFHVGIVYVYASVAKFGPDWLLHAQPLHLWLSSRTDLAFIGPWLDRWELALAMSWAGFLYDGAITGLLLWPRTRRFAYVAVVVFHSFTHVFFQIGVFPLLMTMFTPVFFSPDWPRRVVDRIAPTIGSVWSRVGPPAGERSWRAPSWVVVVVALWCVGHVVVPLRAIAYPGTVLWGEEGMRWSWKVMVREKNGSVTYRVRRPSDGREIHASPSRYLNDRQEREMSGQPDLIVQLAHHVGREWSSRWGEPVEVRVDAFASLNGRAPARLIDPSVDLMTVRVGLAPAGWILPAPAGPPPRLVPIRFSPELRARSAAGGGRVELTITSNDSQSRPPTSTEVSP